jgi:outer membrane protein OmpA-like peptidoglycan-associated protein
MFKAASQIIYSTKSSKSGFVFAILSIFALSGALAQGLGVPLQQPEGTRQATRAGITGQIEDLADPFAQPGAYVQRSQGRIVFYRPRLAALAATASPVTPEVRPTIAQIDERGNVLNLQNDNPYGIRHVTRPLSVGAQRAAGAVQEVLAPQEPKATTEPSDTSADFSLDARQPGAATITVNGDYQTSLVPGGYSQLCLPVVQTQTQTQTQAATRVGVRYTDIARRGVIERMDSTSDLTLVGGGTQYVKVQESGTRMTLTPVSQAQALTELEGTRLQMHTISRVKGQQACQMVDQPITEAITLAGDTLFKFDRSDRAGLTDQGIHALEQLMLQLRERYKSVDHVHLVGYTDPLGSDAYNQRLSLKRAATVSDYMQISPLLRGRISTEGRGAKDLVVTGCGNTPTAQTQACNQPNRRVVVQVTGLRN